MDTKKKVTPLPAAIIPFLLKNLDGFDIALEDSDRIVLTPKDGAGINPESRAYLAAAILQGDGHQTPQKSAQVHHAQPAKVKSILRPKLIYRVADKKLTPEQAERFGFTPQRLSVFKVIHESKAVQAKDIMEKTGLPHGTVQQVLHWLRDRKIVTAEPETM
jgi:hypothetical protein